MLRWEERREDQLFRSKNDVSEPRTEARRNYARSIKAELVHGASEFIPDLPWVTRASPSPGNGPFEGDGVGHRDFSSLHSTCSYRLGSMYVLTSGSFGLLQHVDISRNQLAKCKQTDATIVAFS